MTARQAHTLRVPRGYQPHAKQRVAHHFARQQRRAKLRGIVAKCGRRAGKSEFGSAWLADGGLADIEDKRRGQGRWEGDPHPAWEASKGKDAEPFLHTISVAPIYALLDPNKRKLRRMLGHHQDPGGGLIIHQTDTRWWMAGGWAHDWRTGDRPERLVADAYDRAHLEEFARLKAGVWEDNLQPALADTAAPWLATSTPLGKAGPFYRLWALGDPEACQDLADETGEDRKLDPMVACIQWATMDNTAAPKLVAEALAMRGRMPDAMWRRNFEASWTAFVGQCFPMLSEADHFRRIPLVGLRNHAAGMDFGYSEPGVCAIVGRDYDGGYHEVAAHSERQMEMDSDDAWRLRDDSGKASVWTVAAFRLLKGVVGEQWSRTPLYLPHDRPDAHQMFRRRGFNVRPAYQDRHAGLTWFQMAVAAGRWDMSSRLVYRSFESLRHPDNKTGPDAELWQKVDDHAFDAARYAMSEAIERGERAPSNGSLLGWSAR